MLIVHEDGTWTTVEGSYLIDTDNMPADAHKALLATLANGSPADIVNYADAKGVPISNVLHRAGYTV